MQAVSELDFPKVASFLGGLYDNLRKEKLSRADESSSIA
jgi:hypothetical protein